MNNKRKTEYMEKKKEVLIIIPAYNEEKTITALLERLKNLRFQNLQMFWS